MTDVFSPEQRSAVMRSVPSRQSKAEQIVERILRSMRFRPRLNDSSLPGSPDFVIVSRKTVVFVHGCFWHRCRCEAGQSMPATRVEYWEAKFARNRRRDRRVRRELQALGWTVLVVWECQTRPRQQSQLTHRLCRALNVKPTLSVQR